MKKFFLLGVIGLACSVPANTFADSNASGGGVINSESQILGGPFDHDGGSGAAGNSSTAAAFIGGFNATNVRFSGTSTSNDVGSWENEVGIEITDPAGFFGETFLWETNATGQTYTSFDYDNSRAFGTAFGGSIAVAGNWGVEFVDSFNDGGIDSTSTNVVMTFEEVTAISDSNGSFSLGSMGLGDSSSNFGELALGNLFDSYTFTLTDAGLFTVETDFLAGFTGDLLDSEIAIFDSAGNLLAEDDDGGNAPYSGIFNLALAAGDYTLVVAGWDTTFGDGFDVVAGGSTGDYGVFASFSAVPEPSMVGLLALVGVAVGANRRRKA